MAGELSARERWDAKHRRIEVGGGEPCGWLVAHRDLLEERVPGRALDLACGGGRHALLLAGLGFDVDAVDVADVAIARVQERAAARGLAVHALRLDLEVTPFPRPPYDVIVNVNYLQRSLFGSIAAALAPGGLLVFETFSRDQIDVLGASLDPAFALAPGELLDAFAGLRVLAHREAIVDEGGRVRAVASLVAVRA